MGNLPVHNTSQERSINMQHSMNGSLFWDQVRQSKLRGEHSLTIQPPGDWSIDEIMDLRRQLIEKGYYEVHVKSVGTSYIVGLSWN